MNEGKVYHGKYRGTVVNNVDPLQKGRILATVPDVLQTTPCSWAMPCLPVLASQDGMFAVPGVGAGVWIEFEQGKSEFPVWTGCFPGKASDVPSFARGIPPGVSSLTIQTKARNALVLSDVPGTGGILIRSSTGALIQVDDTGITIDNGKGAKVTLKGPSVDINSGALTIT